MCIGTLLPQLNETPKVDQIYVHDPKDSDQTAHIKFNHIKIPRSLSEAHKTIILDLFFSIEDNFKISNPYVKKFRNEKIT